MSALSTLPAADPAAAARAAPDDRERLASEVVARAVKFGEGVDHGGRPMPWILDVREVLLSQPGLELAARLLWRELAPWGPDAVAGVGVSGAPLVAALMLVAGRDGEALAGLVVRERPKGYGRARTVEGPLPRAGARVAIVDDVVNSGATLDAAARALGEIGARAIGAAALVDLESPRARDVTAAHGLALRALFTPGDLGFGVRLPSHRRVARELPPAAGRPDAPAAEADGLGFELGGDGSVAALDARSGRVRWRFVAGRGRAGGVAVCADVVAVSTPDRFVAGVDRATGTLRWIANVGVRSPGDPCAVDRRAVAVVAGGEVFVLDARDGDLLWRCGPEAGARAVSSSGDGTFTVHRGAGATRYALEDG